VPLRFFDQQEALMVATAAARIFPGDAASPGAPETGVVVDRCLKWLGLLA
jgi:hypothetical protein